MQSMDFYDDGRTLANFLASHVFYIISDSMSGEYRNLRRKFDRAAKGILLDQNRYEKNYEKSN